MKLIAAAACLIFGISASPITFTIKRTGTGTLNGTSFINQSLTFVIVADTNTLTQQYKETPSSFAITIGGLGTVNVTDSTYVFDNQGASIFGFGTNSDRSQFTATAFSSYGLVTPIGPITPTTANVSNWSS